MRTPNGIAKLCQRSAEILALKPNTEPHGYVGHLTEHLRRLPLELKAPLVYWKMNRYNCHELLHGFNIFKASCGDGRAVVRTFRGIVSNAQGEIFLQFVPGEDYACINAIQVVPEQH